MTKAIWDATHLENLRSSIAELARTGDLSTAFKIKILLPQIDMATAAGLKHTSIVRMLNENGIEISYTVYSDAIYRHRKRAKKSDVTIRPPKLLAPKMGESRPDTPKENPVFNYDPFRKPKI